MWSASANYPALSRPILFVNRLRSFISLPSFAFVIFLSVDTRSSSRPPSRHRLNWPDRKRTFLLFDATMFCAGQMILFVDFYSFPVLRNLRDLIDHPPQIVLFVSPFYWCLFRSYSRTCSPLFVFLSSWRRRSMTTTMYRGIQICL